MEGFGVGRGRGVSTNVPERALIEQVKIRPLLYDKTVKDYRKPGVSDAAWNEVAKAVDTQITNCKKRWKSLRDTFIKYYRWEVQYNNGGIRRKHKAWVYYRDLAFLKPHVELFRLEDGGKDGGETVYIKDTTYDTSDCEKTRYSFVEVDDVKEVYEIKETDEEEYRLKDESFIEPYEEDLEEQFQGLENEENLLDKADEIAIEEHYAYDQETENVEIVEEIEESQQQESVIDNNILKMCQQVPLDVQSALATTSSSAKNIVDPDERYLMSCLPAFKRFTTQQKAYVRMGIERLFYEVEFENISEPKNKRSRMS